MTNPPAGGLGAPCIARQQDDFGALIRKKLCDGFSDAHRSAGYHYHFPGDIYLARFHIAGIHSVLCHDNKCFSAISLTYSASFAVKSS